MVERTLTLAQVGTDLATRSRATHATQAPQRQDTEPTHASLRPLVAARVVQPRLVVGVADDPFEREAERSAHAVTSGDRMPATSAFDGSPLAGRLMRLVQRAVGKAEPEKKKDDDEKEKRARKAPDGPGGPGIAPVGIESDVQAMSAGGSPLPTSVRSMFEPRFGFDFSDVRIHTSNQAAGAALSLGARAFTVGDHVFFGPGQYQPTSRSGQHLIAHELTHTIQQKPGAARAARLLAAPRQAQRFLQDVKDSIAEKIRTWVTRDFPPWDLITLIIGWDPIRNVAVKGSTKDWIRAAMKLAPEGEALFAKLDAEGKVDVIAAWWDTEVAKLDLTYDKIVALIKEGWERLSAGDIFDPLGAWNDKIKPLIAPVAPRVWNFIRAVGAKVFQVVKDLVLKAVVDWAKEQKGYPLLTMVLGRDPVTGEEVKPTLKGVIYAVLDLVPGGDKIKDNLEKAKTVEKAAAWFKFEVGKLQLTWAGIKALFSQAWDAFKVVDLLNLKLLLEKMWAIFGPPVTRLIAFLIAVGKKILEFVFEGAMLIAGPIGLQIVSIVRKIGDTFNLIVSDPVAFIGHLVDAVVKGVRQFGQNIWEHLKTGLIEWLVGTLGEAGLVLPKVWDLKGILDLVLQILGITWAKIRAKLVAVVGEKTVAMLETAFVFIKTLVIDGPAAAWKEIVAAIGNLWDMVIGGIKDWAITKIVTAAITKLATMFNPVGAVIQAIIATYNAIAFFIERIKQILTFVEAVVDSIANIAQGKIAAAANYVERAMARAIPVLLGFLARLIGLGDVSGAIKKVITAIQEKVDKAIDSVINWVVEKAKSLFGKKDDKEDPKWAAGVAGVTKDVDAMPEAERSEDGINKRVASWKTAHGFTELKLIDQDGELVIEGAMSPGKKVKTVKPSNTGAVYGAVSTRGYGTSVTVTRLPPKPTGGSTPSVTSDAWVALGKRRNDNSPRDYYYVRGHLLNHNLGGPGSNWQNLTPLTQVANNRGLESMLRQFEKPVKDALTAKKAVTDFSVVASGGVNRSAELAEIGQAIKTEKSAPEKTRLTVLQGVLTEEQYIPTKVVCKANIAGAPLNIDIDNSFSGTKWNLYQVAS